MNFEYVKMKGGIPMIPPRKLEREARKKEKENLEFRVFLKENANLEELDGKFLRLHKQLFAEYDCSRCRNCCKMYKANILEEDIEKSIVEDPNTFAETLYIYRDSILPFVLDSFACYYLNSEYKEKVEKFAKDEGINKILNKKLKK